jgi:hypothetical protein
VTPLAVEMLIWFCTRAVPDCQPFPNIERDPQQEIIRWMLDADVIRTSGHSNKPMATEKGRAWLELICATPMPIHKWADPREDDGGRK